VGMSSERGPERRSMRVIGVAAPLNGMRGRGG
jgi:hypothetical protein